MNDHAEPVCCEMPMIRHDEIDVYGGCWHWYECPQCGSATSFIKSEEAEPVNE
jgi:hypothetical protein